MPKLILKGMLKDIKDASFKYGKVTLNDIVVDTLIEEIENMYATKLECCGDYCCSHCYTCSTTKGSY